MKINELKEIENSLQELSKNCTYDSDYYDKIKSISDKRNYWLLQNFYNFKGYTEIYCKVGDQKILLDYSTGMCVNKTNLDEIELFVWETNFSFFIETFKCYINEITENKLCFEFCPSKAIGQTIYVEVNLK